MTKKCLFISAHAPTNLYPQAGQKIAFKYLLDYQNNDKIIDIIVIANSVEIAAATDLSSKFSQQLYIDSLSKFQKIIRCLYQWQLPCKFATRYSTTTAKKIQQLLSQNQYDTIHFEYSHAAVYLDLILNHSTYNHQTSIIISIHDIITQSILRQATQFPILGIEAARIFKYEKSLYTKATQLWVLSDKDRDILRSLYGIAPEKVIVKSPATSSFITNLKRDITTIKPKTLMFWGAMNRPENEQGVFTFVDECFCQILNRDRDYKLYIVGAYPSPKLRSLASSNIIVTGFVEDPSPYFAMAAWGIVPLTIGAGVKLKTLEMLAAGIPVISTSVGAEGVNTHGERLMINDNITQWVDVILSNPPT